MALESFHKFTEMPQEIQDKVVDPFLDVEFALIGEFLATISWDNIILLLRSPYLHSVVAVCFPRILEISAIGRNGQEPILGSKTRAPAMLVRDHLYRFS